MQSTHCDASALKVQLRQQLTHIGDEIQRSLDHLDQDAYCLLTELDDVKEAFRSVESIAASFYLQCYLASFTTSYVELSVGIQHLAERRHGALIVIQRSDELEAFIHSGIPIAATLSHSLLESIFYPGNPLHDGAVWIKEDRIVSAANVLPVSSVWNGHKKMGTRHRAAMGLSERTDALVLVVSEETGIASFAYEGKLHPMNAIGQMVEKTELFS
ncbi:sporulation-specific diadenylate cyclase CdaS [Paenibacillus piri]|uniref:Diadenylate cyclase n=1 Tax=Paenibacillus piri TaxID=2547395 RepID=A0A4V2ZU92_9BACL|nr:sporulation-specific diadenylate cyclase CdaS [Paenibacillus piri]TDG00105.1 hypothetical protein E1757_00155 [Paenibacillus piri]